jgi:hypothetical protein
LGGIADLTSAVSGSAIADGMDAGLLKTENRFLVFHSNVKKLRNKIFFFGPHLFPTALGSTFAKIESPLW